MRPKILSLLIAVTLAQVASTARGWNGLGHKVVAEIAWQQLDAPTRQSIVDTLKHHPRFAEDFLAKMPRDVATADQAKQDRWIFWQAACWPDIARGGPYDRPWWHYIDVPIYLDMSDRRALADKVPFNQSFKYPTSGDPADYNVVQAIAYCRATIADKSTGPDAKALAYCWLFHLVGDLHQPLHSCALVSVNRFPKGDRGGNQIPLTRGNNLHSLWDNLLGRSESFNNVCKVAAELSNRDAYGDVWDSAAKETDVRRWLVESHQLAESFVYSSAILEAVRNTPVGSKMVPVTPSTEYLKAAGNYARERVVAAGVRLATLLDRNGDVR